jgi:hypothetical protein
MKNSFQEMDGDEYKWMDENLFLAKGWGDE